MTILLEPDGTAAAALRGVLGPNTQLADSLHGVHGLLGRGSSHDLIVVGPEVEKAVALDLASSQRVTNPELGVVLLRRRVNSAVLREAMLAGVRDVVAADDVAAVADACRRSRELSEQVRAGRGVASPAAGATGRLVTVFSAKGGCGKTTLATNIASALAQAGQRVCLVDLDLAFGDVAIAMQLTPTRTLADALGLSQLDDSAVRSLVTTHSSGVDTILAPVEPGTAESIGAPLVGSLLDLLKASYDLVVVDSPPAFTDHVLAAFDRSEYFVLLATLDIPALKNLKLTLETLEILRYPRERCHVVLNRSDAKVGLSLEDVVRTLKTPIALQVPSSRAVPASVNRGVPIVLDQPGHPVSVAIKTFARTRLLADAPVGDPGPWAVPIVEAPSGKAPRRGLGRRRRAEVTAR